jgi:hypothetical protein
VRLKWIRVESTENSGQPFYKGSEYSFAMGVRCDKVVRMKDDSMRKLIHIYFVIGSICCLIGVIFGLLAKGRSPLSRLALSLTPVAAFFVIWNWYVGLVIDPVFNFWSGLRLFPAVALTYGYSPYQAPEDGLANGWIYPPGSVLAYLPATLFSDPTNAVLAGRCLSLLYYFGPVIGLLVFEVRRGRLKAGLACLLFMDFAVISHRVIALRYPSTEIHADAPALGLGAISLAMVGRIRGDRLGMTGFAAVLAAICATLTKQVQAPLMLIPTLWIAASSRHIWTTLRALAITAALALVFVVPVVLICGPRVFFFNMWTLPGHHGMKYQTMAENARLIEWCLVVQARRPLLFTLGLALLSLVFIGAKHAGGLRILRDDPIWLSFLVGAIFEIPIAALGYMKRGGDFNALAYALYPLLIAVILILGRCVWSARSLAALLVAFTLYLGVSETRHTIRNGGDSASAKRSWITEEQMVLRYLQEHPGEAYFPLHTLDHLKVDGRRYHSDDGVNSWRLSGYAPSRNHIRKYMPPQTRIICYPPGPG